MIFKLGELVYSKAGRDAGRKFVIIDILDENYVLITDGSLRKTTRPKKKKIKHIEKSGIIIDSLKEKFENKENVTNAEIKKCIAQWEGKTEAEE